MKLKSDLLYKIIGVFLFIYMLILVSRTSYLNYKINKQIEGLKTSVTSLEKDNRELSSDLEYFKTDQYKEKVARERLGLKKQNEEVMVIVPEEEGEKEKKKVEIPNYQKWWKFISSKS